MEPQTLRHCRGVYSEESQIPVYSEFEESTVREFEESTVSLVTHCRLLKFTSF